MKKSYAITEELVYYDPKLKLSWAEGGAWPHPNHYWFHEAVVAAHFRLRGYESLHDYNSTKAFARRPICNYFTQLFHYIIGARISEFLITEAKQTLGADHGQPDLFIFREDRPNDPKIRYPDSLLWFFVEVKGPGENIRDTQLKYWRLIADSEDLDLGPKRIRLHRALPEGAQYQPRTFEY
jgi:hypothetical protein